MKALFIIITIFVQTNSINQCKFSKISQILTKSKSFICLIGSKYLRMR